MGLHMPLLTELKNLLAGATTNMSHLRRFWTCACNLFSNCDWHGGSNRIKAVMVWRTLGVPTRRSLAYFSPGASSGALFHGYFEEKDGKTLYSGGRLARDESMPN